MIKFSELQKRFKGYASVSALSLLLNFLLTITLHEIVGLSPKVAYGITLSLLFVVNFGLMRYWAYREHSTSINPVNQMLLCGIVSLLFRVFEWAMFYLLNNAGTHYIIAMCIVMGVSFALKFFVYDRLVFRRPGA